jgi:hypothetical protein
MLSCKEAAALMSQEQDRQLGFGERIGLRLHLLICAGCSNYRRQMEVMRAACRQFGGWNKP